MADKVIINVRERPLSTDLMLMQALEQRTNADVLKYFLGTEHSRFQDGLGGQPNAAFAESLVGGLIPSGAVGSSAVSITPGVLLQNSSTLPPVPSGADSTYRIAALREPVSVSLPTPGGSGLWYLLRVQMTELTTISETRDIMNSQTAKFEPTNVPKVKEWRIAFSWQAGTVSNLPVPEDGYVAIAGVFVQSAGTLTVVLDMRPTAYDRCQTRRQNWGSQPRTYLTTNTTPQAASESIRVSVEEAISNQDLASSLGGGIRMRWMSGLAGELTVTPINATIISPGTALVPGSWYYLYLSPWFDYAPAPQLLYDAAGVLTLSSVAPVQNYNGALLTLPAPWSNFSVPIGVAPCVGVMLRVGNPLAAGANDGWCMMRGKDGVYSFFQSSVPGNVPMLARITGTPATTRSIDIPPSKLPANALSMKLRVVFAISSGAQQTATVRVLPLGATGAANAYHSIVTMMTDNFAAPSLYVDLEAPYDATGLTIEVISGGTQTISVVAVSLLEITTR